MREHTSPRPSALERAMFTFRTRLKSLQTTPPTPAFHADPYLFMGIETDLTYPQVRWTLAYLLTEFERLPRLAGTPDDLTPVELVELLWRCYGCRPVIRTRAIGFDHEIEIWRLYHDREMLDVEHDSKWAMTLSRPGVRRAMLELMLDSVRKRLGLTVQQIKAD